VLDSSFRRAREARRPLRSLVPRRPSPRMTTSRSSATPTNERRLAMASTVTSSKQDDLLSRVGARADATAERARCHRGREASSAGLKEMNPKTPVTSVGERRGDEAVEIVGASCPTSHLDVRCPASRRHRAAGRSPSRQGGCSSSPLQPARPDRRGSGRRGDAYLVNPSGRTSSCPHRAGATRPGRMGDREEIERLDPRDSCRRQDRDAAHGDEAKPSSWTPRHERGRCFPSSSARHEHRTRMRDVALHVVDGSLEP